MEWAIVWLGVFIKMECKQGLSAGRAGLRPDSHRWLVGREQVTLLRAGSAVLTCAGVLLRPRVER